MLIPACAAVFLGLVFVAIGAWGRRIGVEPRCRKCGFDVTGLVERGTPTCPECGSSIAMPRATVIGSRRRLRWVIATGLVLIFAGGFGVSANSKKAKWIPYVPSQVLTRYTAWTVHDGALDELVARLKDDRLGQEGVQRVIAAALRAQSDIKREWNPQWGVFFETASQRGLTSAADDRAYLDHVITVTGVQSRNATLPGWSVPVMAQYEPRRGGIRDIHLAATLEADIKGFKRFGVDVWESNGGPMGVGDPRSGTNGTGLGGDRASVPAAPPGEHTFAIDFRWWTLWEDDPRAATIKSLPPSGHWSEERPIRIAASIEEIVRFVDRRGGEPDVICAGVTQDTSGGRQEWGTTIRLASRPDPLLTDEEIEARVIAMVEKAASGGGTPISRATRLAGGDRAIDAVNLAAMLDYELGVTMVDEDFAAFSKVGDIGELIARRRAAPESNAAIAGDLYIVPEGMASEQPVGRVMLQKQGGMMWMSSMELAIPQGCTTGSLILRPNLEHVLSTTDDISEVLRGELRADKVPVLRGYNGLKNRALRPQAASRADKEP